MSDLPIQHVTDTAFWVATYRALENERADALFRDPLAARLVEGRGHDIAERMPHSIMLSFAIVIRTCIIDDFIRGALREGCDAIVNLGAGLDTRPYRMDLPATLPFIEVDFKDTIAFKGKRLADVTPRCQLERISLDLSDRFARRALFHDLNAKHQKLLVLTEGVIPYLSCDEVASLGNDMSAQPHFALWIVEYFSPLLAKVAGLARARQMANAPFRFTPDHWHRFFRQTGWIARETKYFAEEGRRRNRLPPMKGLVHWLARLLPERQRVRLQQSYGYALMERADASRMGVTPG